MIYPFIFLLVSWLFGGTGTVGEVEFLPAPESLPAWQRAVLVAYFLLMGIGFFILGRNLERIDKLTNGWLDQNLWQRLPNAHRRKAKILLPLGVGVSLFAIFYVGLGLPLALAVAGAGALAVAVAVAEGTVANAFSATFLLFFLLLPFVNALFDWASWQVSRWLGDNLLTISKKRDYPRWKRGAHYLKDIVIDGGFALLCLIGLAWAIPRVIEAFNGLIQWLQDETIFTIGDYLCAAAREPLGDGFWATSMLFSTLFPTAIHLSILLVAPFLWGLTPGEKSRARAAHLTHGTQPPAIDLRGKGSAGKTAWPTPMPTNYGTHALREDQAVFQGRLNETTLHAITIQLRVLRPLYYTVGLMIVGALLYWLGGLFISSWRPLPQILLWIAHNFDYIPVRDCFPKALPTAPFETLPI